MEAFEALQGSVIQGVARGVEAEALEDGLLPAERKVVGVFRDDGFGGEAEGGDAASERTGGCGGDQGRKGAVVLATEFWPDGAPFDEAALHLTKVADEFGGQKDLVGASDDEPGAAFKRDVHLTLAGMADLDFDE